VEDGEGVRRGSDSGEDADPAVRMVHGSMELCGAAKSAISPRPGEDAFDGNQHGDIDAAFPRGKPSSDQRRAA
jgi:hypothetical protein